MKPDQDVSNDDLLAMLAGTLLPSDIKRRRAERQLIKARNKLKGALQNQYEILYAKLTMPDLLKRIWFYRSGAHRGTSIHCEYEAHYQALRKLIRARDPSFTGCEKPKRIKKEERRILAKANRGCGKSKDR